MLQRLAKDPAVLVGYLDETGNRLGFGFDAELGSSSRPPPAQELGRGFDGRAKAESLIDLGDNGKVGGGSRPSELGEDVEGAFAVRQSSLLMLPPRPDGCRS